MAKIHHLFVIDPIETLDIKLDSSLRMAQALCNIGHSVSICSPHQMEWLSSESSAAALTEELTFATSELDSLRSSRPRRLRLDFFQAIYMRKDPPYDLNYIATTWLLDSAAARGVKVFNAPSALRNRNEKLTIFNFPDAIRDGLVSSQPDSLFEFIKSKAGGDAIFKPLTLYGGRGVSRLNFANQSETEIFDILREETQNGKNLRLVQGFDQRIYQGEVRAFCIGGQALSWCLKRPQNENFLATTRSGATLEAYDPRPDEVAVVEDIARSLAAEGIYFVGFDIIGGYISEINITSPRLLHGPEDLRPYYRDIAEDLARVIDAD